MEHYGDTICNYIFPDDDITSKNSISCMLILVYNINGVPKNLEEFFNLNIVPLSTSCGCIRISETKISDDIEDLYDNYCKYTLNVSRRMGGVAIYVKCALTVQFARIQQSRKPIWKHFSLI